MFQRGNGSKAGISMSCAFRSRGLLSAPEGFAFAIPTTVTGILLVLLLGPRSLLGSRLEAGGPCVAGAKPAIAPALLVVTTPLAARTVETVLREPVPAAEEAARPHRWERHK